jgi:hypothetical protein
MSKENRSPLLFSFHKASFIYDPYPIGLSTNVLTETYYSRLVEEWPSIDLFVFKQELGNKYSLSQVNNRRGYRDFIKKSPPWRQFYEHIKSAEFIRQVIATLYQHNIDLGLQAVQVRDDRNATAPSHWKERVKTILSRRISPTNEVTLSARFEFSMLSANKGCIKPHTDSPQKLITLVLSVVRQGEWNPAFGGGTAVLRPKDLAQNYNYVNKQLEFGQTETITIFPFQPNQCVIFVKTFNSLHAVYPMTGEHSDAMRKTITINIERCD